MSLGNREHVEAVAIIRNLVAAVGPLMETNPYAAECAQAGEQWLSENHPTSRVYVEALRESHGLTASAPSGQPTS
jgi:hypothetical protein